MNLEKLKEELRWQLSFEEFDVALFLKTAKQLEQFLKKKERPDDTSFHTPQVTDFISDAACGWGGDGSYDHDQEDR